MKRDGIQNSKYRAYKKLFRPNPRSITEGLEHWDISLNGLLELFTEKITERYTLRNSERYTGKGGGYYAFNNYTEYVERHIKESELFTYLIYGHEEAPTTGTIHLQRKRD